MMKPIKNKVIKINSSHSLSGSDMEFPPIRGGMPMYIKEIHFFMKNNEKF